jgi:integration host factor subunit beta
VTKKEIVKAISEQIGLTQLKTKEIVQKTFDAIVETLVSERRIELRNFGVFEVKKRAARKARNPRTGERVDVAAKFVVTFKPGKEMEERVRELEEAEAARVAAEAAARAAAEIQADKPVTSEEPQAQISAPATPEPIAQPSTADQPATSFGSPNPQTPPPANPPTEPQTPFGTSVASSPTE